MLIVWRHIGQSIIIDTSIKIAVLGSRLNKVKLGITAPPSVTVYREEERLTRAANATAAWSVDAETIDQILGHLTCQDLDGQPVNG